MKTYEEHKKRHVKLNRALDELVADWIDQTGNLPSNFTIMELMVWSSRQTYDPDDKHGKFAAPT